MPDSREHYPTPVDEMDARRSRAASVFADALPQVLGYDIVTTGEVNTVLVQPPTSGFVIKAPMDLPGYDTRAMLSRETNVVDMLNGGLKEKGIQLPVAIPQLVADSGDSPPRWAAFTSVDGTVLAQRDIRRNFSTEECRDLGSKIGAFAVGMAEAVDPDSFRHLIGNYGHHVIDRESQFKVALGKLSMLEDLGYGNLVDLLAQLRDEYHDLQPDRDAARPIVIHDDLHPGNLAFKENESHNWALSGVFDLANTKIGSAARNFRHLPLLHPETLQSAIDYWHEATGEAVPKRLVNFWTNMHYAVGCVRSIMTYGNVLPCITQTMQLLKPEVDWQSEFSAATPIKGQLENEDDSQSNT
jgi:aminoglycoside phosphotransferase (APT) family kinase protein